jgi:hypothetical protein
MDGKPCPESGFSTSAGIDASGLMLVPEFQIKSRQDCESGLRGGDTGGEVSRAAGMRVVAYGKADGSTSIAAWMVKSCAGAGLGTSAREPNMFKMELIQQSGNEDGPGSAVWVHMGQHACISPWVGTQSSRSPESCSTKTASNTYAQRRTSGTSRPLYSKQAPS